MLRVMTAMIVAVFLSGIHVAGQQPTPASQSTQPPAPAQPPPSVAAASRTDAGADTDLDPGARRAGRPGRDAGQRARPIDGERASGAH